MLFLVCGFESWKVFRLVYSLPGATASNDTGGVGVLVPEDLWNGIRYLLSAVENRNYFQQPTALDL